MIQHKGVLWCLFFSTVLACEGSGVLTDGTNEQDTHSDQTVEQEEDTALPEEEEEVQCVEVTLDIRGPSRPTVGDEWTMIMRCDGAVIVGPTVIRFTPRILRKPMVRTSSLPKRVRPICGFKSEPIGLMNRLWFILDGRCFWRLLMR